MVKWTTGNCGVNGINIHYLYACSNKPLVVLLHGLVGSKECWIPLAQQLAIDYDVIMPDGRGHGKSSRGSDLGYCYETLAADLLGFIKALGLVSPVLIGHSMGGMTAALAACRSPNLVKGLVLADPTFLTPQRQREVYQSGVADEHRRILSLSKQDYRDQVRALHRKRSHELIDVLVEARFQTSIDAFEVLKPPNPEYRQLIQDLKIPSLLVVGGARGVVSLDEAKELARLNHQLEIAQIVEAGHGIPYDQPERFCAIVKAFLQSVCS